MATITIPRKLTKGEELIIIPRKEYERILSLKTIPEFRPTTSQKRALMRGRKNRQSGNFFTLDELKNKLGLAN